MAKPIEETPILKGKDAEIFLANMKRNEFKTISIEELDKMKENFKKLDDISISDSEK
jgi:hypothetical protein